jgi:hypothetical protein
VQLAEDVNPFRVAIIAFAGRHLGADYTTD